MDTQTTTRRRRFANVLVHLLFIVIIFVLPELVMAIAMPHRRGFVFYPGFYVKTLILIGIFYLNYFVIIDRTIGRTSNRRIWSFILINLVLIIAGLFLSDVISNWLSTMPPRRHSRSGTNYFLKYTSFLLRDAVTMLLVIGLSVALRLSAKWRDLERSNQDLISAQRTIELANLKSQLNPHFLFNTLNTIYALVDISPDDAKKAVHRLSALLRYMLYEDVKNVALRRETDFITDYVDLMKLRIADREIKVDIDLGDNGDREIPPLLFIPLVENAFKYGISAPDNVPVEIAIKARDKVLTCTTSNSFIPGTKADKEASGIGLSNLRRRLALIYGQNATLRITCRDNIYRTKLTVLLDN